jgi:hypothetical protein
VIIYVAGSSSEPERVRRAMDEVVGRGWTLAQDWLADIEREGAANPTDDEVRNRCADKDLSAVFDADVLWLLVPTSRSSGAWVEFGYAIALRLYRATHQQPERPIIIASGNTQQSIFCSLADREFSDDSDVCQWLAMTKVANR